VQFLREHGCDQVQGYYYSTPVRFEDFTNLMRDDIKAVG